MRIADRRHPSLGEWVAAIAVVGAAAAVTDIFGIAAKWQNAITFTVLLFVTVLIVTRPVWGRGEFWLDLVAIFLLHCIILTGIEHSLPAESAGPRGIPMVGCTVLEGIFVVIVLWVRAARSRSDAS